MPRSLHIRGVQTARQALSNFDQNKQLNQKWAIDALAGRFVEIVGIDAPAALTPTTLLLREAQRRGEPVAWVGSTRSVFYPPDLASHGIDLAALPVIRVADIYKAFRATDCLLRSGGFGLVILDLDDSQELNATMQVRLSCLAREFNTVLLCLTRRNKAQLAQGSLASLRAEVTSEKVDFNHFNWELRITKDKCNGPGWQHKERCCGPNGLC
jgi:recombination protein RecA